jgi:hypothetical protein
VLQYKRIILVVAGISLIFIGYACAGISPKQPSEEGLKERVQQFYNNWKKLKFSKCIEFLLPGMISDKKEYVKKLEGMPYKIIDFKIESIEIDNNKAKVKMSTTKVEGGKKDTDSYFDSWEIKDGRWYLSDFGRSDGTDDTVKEYEYIPKYK